MKGEMHCEFKSTKNYIFKQLNALIACNKGVKALSKS